MSLCQVTLIGRIGAVDLKPNIGRGLTSLRVAVAHVRRNPNPRGKDDRWLEETDWHSVDRWHRDGIEPTEHHVGDLVCVIGTGRIDTWADKETGADRYGFKVVAQTIRTLIRSDRQEGEQRPAPRSNRSDHHPF